VSESSDGGTRLRLGITPVEVLSALASDLWLDMAEAVPCVIHDNVSQGLVFFCGSDL
jgi:hypothetical protein